MSAVAITPELLHKLEHYPMPAGIKDSTGNAGATRRYARNSPS
jgi:hypothetical protein